MLHGSEPGVCRKEQRSESSFCEVRCHGATLASPSGRRVSGLAAGGEGPPVVSAWPLRRVDRDGKCYTGVLCGLGWNPTTGAPILPEHDIELAFDVQFSVEDIIEINILRAAINKLVCDGPNGSEFLGPERIAQLQSNARQKLLGLFCQLKPRQRVVPKWHEKPYEWNQVDPKLVMEQADRESGRGKNTFLYQLHKLIVLST